MGHKSVDRSARTISTFSFDDLFMNDEGEIVEESDAAEGEEGGPRGVNILVAKDSNSRALFAHVVPSKGVDEGRFAVDILVEDCKWLGYSKIILKSDNETGDIAPTDGKSKRNQNDSWRPGTGHGGAPSAVRQPGKWRRRGRREIRSGPSSLDAKLSRSAHWIQDSDGATNYGVDDSPRSTIDDQPCPRT